MEDERKHGADPAAEVGRTARDAAKDPIAATERAKTELRQFRTRVTEGSSESFADFLRDRTWLAEVLAEPGFRDAVLDSVLAELEGAGRGPAADAAAAPLGRFGRFELRATLGHGGMGSVYLAFDTVLGREVALKRIRPELLQDEQVRRRFDAEARALSAVDHPNVCRLLDVGEQDGVPFLVMHHERGETLAEKIRREADTLTDRKTSVFESREAITDVVLQIEKVARALHHAHEAGLIHRDVKPGNIVVRHDGEPVLLDFGLVRAEHSDTALTASGVAPGTRPYMSPEQILPGRELDRRTDVYSLGVVLYECLALEHPFASESVHEFGLQILAGAPTPVGRVNRRVPKDLRVVVDTAMDVERERRYATAADLADDLAALRRFEPIRARPAGPLRRARRWCQRHPARAAFLALLVVSLCVAAALWLQSAGRLESFRQAANVTTLDRLRATEATVYPVWRDPSRAQGWLATARPLLDALPELRRQLDALRVRAAPYGPDDAELDRASHPRAEELARMRRERDTRQAELDGMRKAEADSAAKDRQRAVAHQVEALGLEIEELDREVAQRSTFRMADPVEQLLHDVLNDLIRSLERFADEEFVRVSREVEWTESPDHAANIDGWRAAWAEVAADLRADARYAGFELNAQPALLPLGKDSASRLWEFWHPRSGARPALAADQGAPGEWRVGAATGIVLVLLPPGEFDMGVQTEDRELPNYSGEEAWLPRPWESMPVRRVEVGPTLLAKYELTQGQWCRLSGGPNPSKYEGDDRPVEQVSWLDCWTLLARFGFGLPSEVQWEYACRGGCQTAWWSGDRLGSLEHAANVADRALVKGLRSSDLAYWDIDDGFGQHAPVGSFRANPFGLHDVHGNVAEWCEGYAEEYASSKDRIVRGGSYIQHPYYARCWSRDWDDMTARYQHIGVRPLFRVDR